MSNDPVRNRTRAALGWLTLVLAVAVFALLAGIVDDARGIAEARPALELARGQAAIDYAIAGMIRSNTRIVEALAFGSLVVLALLEALAFVVGAWFIAREVGAHKSRKETL